jgi:hypothetical protein
MKVMNVLLHGKRHGGSTVALVEAATRSDG